jgi:hypothetical protein
VVSAEEALAGWKAKQADGLRTRVDQFMPDWTYTDIGMSVGSSEVKALVELYDDLARRAQRVRDLHTKIEHPAYGCCRSPWSVCAPEGHPPACAHCKPSTWPCPTIAELDGLGR